MKGAAERVDLGALGCTKDGFQLVAVGMLFMVLPFEAARLLPDAWESWSLLAAEILATAGGALLVLGVAVMSPAPSGPFYRWLKRGLILVFVLGVLLRVERRLDLFEVQEGSGYLVRGGAHAVSAALWIVDGFGWWAFLLMYLGCALYCFRRRFHGAGLAWATLAVGSLALRFSSPDLPGPAGPLLTLGFPLLVVLGGFLAARSLGAQIRGLSRQTA